MKFEEWLSQQNGVIEVDCGCVTTEAFYHWMRVAYEAGNSPVIPDGSSVAALTGIPMIPDGYVMEPKEVTPEIGNAINEVGHHCTCGNCSQRLWDLLLAAAPQEVR